MSDDGYTLTEMLVALVLAGLAMTGLGLAMRMTSHAELRTERAAARHAATAAIRREARALLAQAGPFETPAGLEATLTGSPTAADFPCAGRTCRIAVTGPAVRPTLQFTGGDQHRAAVLGTGAERLSYVSAADGRLSTTWPPADRADRLGAVVILGRDGVLAVAPVGRDQPAACAFDLRVGGCATLEAP